jgi:bacillithiol system protein YtxJ
VRCVEVLVREDRPLSLAVAERTGVAHESPQVILLSGGRARWHASHRAVTLAALREACAPERPAAD